MNLSGASKTDLVATAYHEAGHAVMAVSLDRNVEKVTILPGNMQAGGVRLGACKLKKGRTHGTKDWIEDEVLILYAGMVAESRFTGRYCQIGAREDLRIARGLLGNRAGTEKKLDRLQKRMLGKTEYVLDDQAHTAAIESVAKELIEKKTISGRAVRHFFDEATKKHS